MRVLITGGRSDIGQEIAKKLSGLGHFCYVTGSSTESCQNLNAVYREIENTKIIPFNLLRPETTEREIGEVISSGIDCVIFNASTRVKELKMFHEYSKEEEDEEINGNLKGNIWLLRKVIPKMIEQNFGRLVLISSVVAISGSSRYGLYSMTKGGLESLFLNIAVDYGKYDILSNIIRPGIIKTQRTKRFWERELYEKRLSRRIPQMKLGEPRHIANSILPLLDKDSYINGATLNVSGGLPLTKSEGL